MSFIPLSCVGNEVPTPLLHIVPIRDNTHHDREEAAAAASMRKQEERRYQRLSLSPYSFIFSHHPRKNERSPSSWCFQIAPLPDKLMSVLKLMPLDLFCHTPTLFRHTFWSDGVAVETVTWEGGPFRDKLKLWQQQYRQQPGSFLRWDRIQTTRCTKMCESILGRCSINFSNSLLGKEKNWQRPFSRQSKLRTAALYSRTRLMLPFLSFSVSGFPIRSFFSISLYARRFPSAAEQQETRSKDRRPLVVAIIFISSLSTWSQSEYWVVREAWQSVQSPLLFTPTSHFPSSALYYQDCSFSSSTWLTISRWIKFPSVIWSSRWPKIIKSDFKGKVSALSAHNLHVKAWDENLHPCVPTDPFVSASDIFALSECMVELPTKSASCHSYSYILYR